jgi:hypothetical protein
LQATASMLTSAPLRWPQAASRASSAGIERFGLARNRMI